MSHSTSEAVGEVKLAALVVNSLDLSINGRRRVTMINKLKIVTRIAAYGAIMTFCVVVWVVIINALV